jgi:hypothetical protein
MSLILIGPDERCALELFHPPSVILTPFTRSLLLVGCIQGRVLTTIRLLKGDSDSGRVEHDFICAIFL